MKEKVVCGVFYDPKTKEFDFCAPDLEDNHAILEFLMMAIVSLEDAFDLDLSDIDINETIDHIKNLTDICMGLDRKSMQERTN